MNRRSGYAIALRSYKTTMSAIRSNVGSLAVTTVIYAAWCHVASSNNDNFYDHCPDGPNMSCLFEIDLANLKYVAMQWWSMPMLFLMIYPIWQPSNEMFAWEDPESKQNKSLNGIILNRMPKTYFIKYKQFTAARFNIRNLATLMTLCWKIPLKVVLMGILHELPLPLNK